MRLAPRPRTALVVFALYLLVFYGVWQLTGVVYNDIGDSARTIAQWYVAPLAAGAVVLVVAVTVLGWCRGDLRAPRQEAGRCAGSLKTVTGRSWRTPSIVMSTSSL
jgi:hypothetical protein